MISIVASEAIDQLLADRQLLEGITLIFTEVMGGYVFYGLILLGIFGVAYVRSQYLTPVILLGFLLFISIQTIIPAPAIQLGLVLMALGIGGIFYMLFVGRRG